MAKAKAVDVSKLDLYGILDVSPDATEKQILKAYRKRALKCHPDKNPDNPKAADEFHQLSKALEVLTDPAAKEAYDKVLRAKKATELRNRVLDSKRKKLKDDLEAREQSAFQKQSNEKVAAQNLKKEVERLRKEGSRLLQEEQTRLEEEIKTQKPVEPEDIQDTQVAPRLKVKWKAKKGDMEEPEYTKADLIEILSKYGDISALLLSSKKKGSAVVEFESAHAALLAVQIEHGRPSNPLTLTWISGQPADSAPTRPPFTVPITQTSTLFPSFASSAPPPMASSVGDGGDRDYESLVLMKMRQAQERKRLIEQMQEEEEELEQENTKGEKRKEPPPQS